MTYVDDTQMAAAQPYVPDEHVAETPTPPLRPTEPPPGVDQEQMPQVLLGRGVKRDATAAASSSGGEALEPQPRRLPVQPPPERRPATKAQEVHIGTDDGEESEAQSVPSALESETRDADGQHGGNIMKKLAEAMTGIGKSIELMTKRIELIEDQKKKVEDKDGLHSINYKDVEKPQKYDGKQWAVWRTDFLNFLERRDRRWPELLKTIDKRSIDPLTADAKHFIGHELDIHRGTLMNDFTTQLYEYLKNYTTGEVQSRVISGGKDNSWETWRFLCDQGKSRRKIEVHEEYKRLMNPQQVPLESLMKAVTQWESDLLAYTIANDDKGLDEETKKLCLEHMCPEPLQDHLLDKFEQGMIHTYDQYKQVVSTYVYRKAKKNKKKLNHLEADDDAMDDEQAYNGTDMQYQHGDALDYDWDPQIAALKQQAEDIAGKINALVKGKITKGMKGKGKGKGKSGQGGGPAPMQVDHSQKDCYSCGELGHIAANCPKGGKGKGYSPKGGAPQKGDGKGKGKGKNGKGPGKGSWHPSLQSWRNMYPGPSPSQWTEWWRQAGVNNDAYKAKTNLFEQGRRLSHLQQQQAPVWGDEQWQEWPRQSSGQVLQSLFANGNMYKLVQKGPKAEKIDAGPKPVKTKNRFDKLEANDVDEDSHDAHDKSTIEVPLELLIKPESRNRQRRATRSSPTTTTPKGKTTPTSSTSSPTRFVPTMQAKKTTARKGFESSTGTAGGSSPDIKAAIQDNIQQAAGPNSASQNWVRRNATATQRNDDGPAAGPNSASQNWVRRAGDANFDEILEEHREVLKAEFEQAGRAKEAAATEIPEAPEGAPRPSRGKTRFLRNGCDCECEPDGEDSSHRAPAVPPRQVAEFRPVGAAPLGGKAVTVKDVPVKEHALLVEALLKFARQSHGDVIDKPSLKVLRELRQPEKLAPLSNRECPRAPNGWEVISAVVDSGATITALHPKDASAYKVEESAASRSGVIYETAGSEDLVNLGEKKIAVLTTEGTLRGFHSQIAEVSSPLESVRQLLGSKHCVLFGLGEDEEEHLIINKLTGEVNRLRDDGINYLHDMLVVPPDEVANVQDAINAGTCPFGRQGSAQ